MRIFKYPVQPIGYFELELPRGAKVLTVQLQFGNPQMWVSLNPDAKKEKRLFITVATGQRITEKNLTYIGTFQIMNGTLIWHLFEVKKNGKKI